MSIGDKPSEFVYDSVRDTPDVVPKGDLHNPRHRYIEKLPREPIRENIPIWDGTMT